MLSCVRTCNIRMGLNRLAVSIRMELVWWNMPMDANKNSLAEWILTLFGSKVWLRQASGEEQ